MARENFEAGDYFNDLTIAFIKDYLNMNVGGTR